MAFVLISKLYRQMYANTGIATDSARQSRADALGAPDCQAVPAAVHGRPMPEARGAVVAGRSW